MKAACGSPTSPVSSSNAIPLKVQAILLATIALWGFNMPLMKWLTGRFDPVLLAALRMVCATVVMFLLLRGRAPWRALDRGQVLRLLACGVMMVYLNQVCFVNGIARSTATNAALITAINPLAASFLALWFLREPLSARRIAGVLLGLSGVALVILNRPGADLAHGDVGDLLILLAILLFAAGAVLVQQLAVRLDAVTISLAAHGIGALLLLLHAAVQGLSIGAAPRADAGRWGWLLLVVSGAVGTGLGNLLWNRAIGVVGMARASVWLYWLPLFGMAPAVALLGEPVTHWHAIGLVLVLAGTRLGGRRPA